MKQALIYIFGGTGDLSFKKLYPAFYALYKKSDLPENFQIIVVGRRALQTSVIQVQIKQRLIADGDVNTDAQYEQLNAFLSKIHYHQMAFDNEAGYAALNTLSRELIRDNATGKIAYLATAPAYFEVIAQNLTRCGYFRKWERESSDCH